MAPKMEYGMSVNRGRWLPVQSEGIGQFASVTLA